VFTWLFPRMAAARASVVGW